MKTYAKWQISYPGEKLFKAPGDAISLKFTHTDYEQLKKDEIDNKTITVSEIGFQQGLLPSFMYTTASTFTVEFSDHGSNVVTGELGEATEFTLTQGMEQWVEVVSHESSKPIHPGPENSLRKFEHLPTRHGTISQNWCKKTVMLGGDEFSISLDLLKEKSINVKEDAGTLSEANFVMIGFHYVGTGYADHSPAYLPLGVLPHGLNELSTKLSENLVFEFFRDPVVKAVADDRSVILLDFLIRTHLKEGPLAAQEYRWDFHIELNDFRKTDYRPKVQNSHHEINYNDIQWEKIWGPPEPILEPGPGPDIHGEIPRRVVLKPELYSAGNVEFSIVQDASRYSSSAVALEVGPFTPQQSQTIIHYIASRWVETMSGFVFNERINWKKIAAHTISASHTLKGERLKELTSLVLKTNSRMTELSSLFRYLKGQSELEAKISEMGDGGLTYTQLARFESVSNAEMALMPDRRRKNFQQLKDIAIAFQKYADALSSIDNMDEAVIKLLQAERKYLFIVDKENSFDNQTRGEFDKAFVQTFEILNKTTDGGAIYTQSLMDIIKRELTELGAIVVGKRESGMMEDFKEASTSLGLNLSVLSSMMHLIQASQAFKIKHDKSPEASDALVSELYEGSALMKKEFPKKEDVFTQEYAPPLFGKLIYELCMAFQEKDVEKIKRIQQAYQELSSQKEFAEVYENASFLDDIEQNRDEAIGEALVSMLAFAVAGQAGVMATTFLLEYLLAQGLTEVAALATAETLALIFEAVVFTTVNHFGQHGKALLLEKTYEGSFGADLLENLITFGLMKKLWPGGGGGELMHTLTLGKYLETFTALNFAGLVTTIVKGEKPTLEGALINAINNLGTAMIISAATTTVRSPMEKTVEISPEVMEIYRAQLKEKRNQLTSILQEAEARSKRDELTALSKEITELEQSMYEAQLAAMPAGDAKDQFIKSYKDYCRRFEEELDKIVEKAGEGGTFEGQLILELIKGVHLASDKGIEYILESASKEKTLKALGGGVYVTEAGDLVINVGEKISMRSPLSLREASRQKDRNSESARDMRREEEYSLLDEVIDAVKDAWAKLRGEKSRSYEDHSFATESEKTDHDAIVDYIKTEKPSLWKRIVDFFGKGTGAFIRRVSARLGKKFLTTPFQAANSIEEAQSFANDVLGIKADFVGVDLEIANTINEHLHEFAREFGKTFFNEISSDQDHPNLNRPKEENAMMASGNGGKLLYVGNLKSTKNVITEIGKIRQKVGAPWSVFSTIHPEVATSSGEITHEMIKKYIKYVVNHELGHAFHDFLRKRSPGEAQKFSSDYSGEPAYDFSKRHRGDLEKISTYATKTKTWEDFMADATLAVRGRKTIGKKDPRYKDVVSYAESLAKKYNIQRPNEAFAEWFALFRATNGESKEIPSEIKEFFSKNYSEK